MKYSFNIIPKSLFVMALGFATMLILVPNQSQLSAQEIEAAEETKDEQVDAATQARYDEFSKMLSGSKFVGNFTVIGKDNSDLTPEEYHIKSVQKMDKGDMWLFIARIKYGKHDVSVPMPLEVKWSGDDTPVITVTDFSVFGMGPFSSRVVIYNGKYAGTWSHGEDGGHLFGEIKQGEAEGVDVEKSKKEMKEKLEKTKKEGSDKK